MSEDNSNTVYVVCSAYNDDGGNPMGEIVQRFDIHDVYANPADASEFVTSQIGNNLLAGRHRKFFIVPKEVQ